MTTRRLLILAVVFSMTAVAGRPALGLERTYESRHFAVRVEGPADPALVWALLERLESASLAVGRSLGRLPAQRVPVVLYTEGTFPAHAPVPHWAQGFFDGRIRLAVSWAGLQDEGLDKTLRHEYTHAVVHVLTRGRAPTWLTEGLAVANEGRGTQSDWDAVRAADRLMPLGELHGSFMELPPPQLTLAYAESAAAVEYLLSSHGPARVRALLARLKGSDSFADSFHKEIGVSYGDFQAAWARSIIRTSG